MTPTEPTGRRWSKVGADAILDGGVRVHTEALGVPGGTLYRTITTTHAGTRASTSVVFVPHPPPEAP